LTQEKNLDNNEKTKELTGQVERITYSNAESGYSVLRIRVRGYEELVTVVGVLASPAVGEVLKMTGVWQQHPRFGMQFKIETCSTVTPSTLDGIEKYLGSGLIKGIGPSMAEKIVYAFGQQTFEVLDGDPDRLLEIDGLGPKKILQIKKSWAEQRGIRDVMVFLQSYGIGTGYAVRVYKQYGAMTLQVLQENPYRLATDMYGIGFVTADKIAASLGFASDSPLRIKAGVLHVMNQFVSEGNVYVPIMELSARVSELLSVSGELADSGIETARLSEDIAVEWYTTTQGEDDCAVYLPAFQYAEKHSARNLLELMSAPFNGQYVDPETAIPWVQDELGIELADKQKEALKVAISSQVMIITGGPGTGKTTLIRAILKIREARGYRVMLAAPTGRAAKRMAEATGHEAKTIHRLLEYVGKGLENGDFMRNESNPLECDLLIVDEASMIDQILFHHLLKAIPKGASVIFVGDVDQLPSVGSGDVLRDVIDSGVCPVTVLNEIFRQAEQSGIVVNAHRVNSGQMPEFDEDYDKGLKDFYFIAQEDPERVLDTIKTLVTDRIPQRFGFDPQNDIQVLTPMHRGSVGTVRLNEELQKALNTSGGAKVQRMGHVIQEGDKVMQIRNDYDKDVYNGDIGIVYRIDGDETRVVVKMDNGLVSYDFTELDELVHAYAVSIHKSQGSEYPAVVIPIMTQHFVMLQRNLLYTAITRGKKLVVIVGTKKALAIAVKNDRTKQRWTRLASRLREGSKHV
jgi:exodeoxyribonuclease V alpha subunit